MIEADLPLTPIETYSVEKTVVETAVDGTVEIVRDGVDGFLVEPRNPAAIADRVCWLLEHPEEKKKFEENAKVRYQQRFSFGRLANAYADYYKEL